MTKDPQGNRYFLEELLCLFLSDSQLIYSLPDLSFYCIYCSVVCEWRLHLLLLLLKKIFVDREEGEVVEGEEVVEREEERGEEGRVER